MLIIMQSINISSYYCMYVYSTQHVHWVFSDGTVMAVVMFCCCHGNLICAGSFTVTSS